mgnify:CR=1 FL=1
MSPVLASHPPVVEEDIVLRQKLSFESRPAVIPEKVTQGRALDSAQTITEPSLDKLATAASPFVPAPASKQRSRTQIATEEITKQRSMHRRLQEAKVAALHRRQTYGRRLIKQRTSLYVAAASPAKQPGSDVADAFFGTPGEQILQLISGLKTFHSVAAISKTYSVLNVRGLGCMNESAIGVVRLAPKGTAVKAKYDVAVWLLQSQKCLKRAFSLRQIKNCMHPLIQEALRAEQQQWPPKNTNLGDTNRKAKALSVSSRCVNGVVTTGGSEAAWKARAASSEPFNTEPASLVFGAHRVSAPLQIIPGAGDWLHCRVKPVASSKSLRIECVLYVSVASEPVSRMPASSPVVLGDADGLRREVQAVQRKHELRLEARRGVQRALHAQGLTMDGVMGTIPKWQPRFLVAHIDLVSLQHTYKHVSLAGLAIARSASLRQAVAAWTVSHPGAIYVPVAKLNIVEAALSSALPEPREHKGPGCSFPTVSPTSLITPGIHSPNMHNIPPLSATSLPFSASSVQRHSQSLPSSMQSIPLQELEDTWLLSNGDAQQPSSTSEDKEAFISSGNFLKISGEDTSARMLALPSLPAPTPHTHFPPNLASPRRLSSKSKNEAASRIQRMVARCSEKRHRKRETDRLQQACAAGTVQRIVRGHQGRNKAKAKMSMKRRAQAATTLQALQRGRQGRKVACTLKKFTQQQLAEKVMNDAAMRIQRMLRGAIMRKQVSTASPSRLALSEFAAHSPDVTQVAAEPTADNQKTSEPYPDDWNCPSGSTVFIDDEQGGHLNARSESADGLSVIHEAECERAETASGAASSRSSYTGHHASFSISNDRSSHMLEAVCLHHLESQPAEAAASAGGSSLNSTQSSSFQEETPRRAPSSSTSSLQGSYDSDWSVAKP